MAQKQHLIDETARLTVDEIFDAAYASGQEELERSSTALLFSGLIAGLTIGLSPLATAFAETFVGQSCWSCWVISRIASWAARKSSPQFCKVRCQLCIIFGGCYGRQWVTLSVEPCSLLCSIMGSSHNESDRD